VREELKNLILTQRKGRANAHSIPRGREIERSKEKYTSKPNSKN
jgi:hypothetical protein